MKRLSHSLPSVMRASRLGSEGFSVIESVVTAIILVIVVSGSAVLMNSVNRSSTRSDSLAALESAIDSDLAAIRNLSTRFTCCSGVCTVAAPTTFGTSTSACATNDPRDDRYYFPQRDDTTTTANLPNTTSAREPDAVGQLCANNAVFMAPLETAVDALPIPAGTTRATTIRPNRILEVRYTNITETPNRVVRVANILPPMANWCP